VVLAVKMGLALYTSLCSCDMQDLYQEVPGSIVGQGTSYFLYWC